MNTQATQQPNTLDSLVIELEARTAELSDPKSPLHPNLDMHKQLIDVMKQLQALGHGQRAYVLDAQFNEEHADTFAGINITARIIGEFLLIQVRSLSNADR